MVGEHLESDRLPRHQLTRTLVHLTVVNAKAAEDGERLQERGEFSGRHEWGWTGIDDAALSR